jgi:cytochrome P450
MQDAMTGGEGSCPVVHDFRFVGAGEAMTAFGRYDALQDEYRMVRVEEPGGAYYLPLDRDLIVSGMQDTETFSSHALTPLQPNPRYTAIPVMLDPPEHAKWRRLLSGYFGVRQMALLDERIRSVCSELIEAISAMGACDFTEDFAFRFPTTIFLEIFGLPPAELDTFLEWERAILHPGEDGELDRERQFLAAVNLYERLREVIAGRRAAPDPEATDILSDALTWRIDGELVSDEEIVSCCVLLFMAGLDTVANALSFSWRHLATHPDDRAFLAARPTDRGPLAAEELLRAFPIAQIARKVTRETDFGGVQLKAGDMVLFALAAANRDLVHLDGARIVDFGREPVASYTFGTGPHRCLGSHLARREMAVALELWHTRIPEYELAVDEPLFGHWGSVHGLRALPLRWPAPG